MPLPPHPLTLQGGCNCRAIRYTVNIPELQKRPFHPWATSQGPNDNTACRLPFSVWDHCNNCRTATGALLPAWLCVPADMVSVTCVTADFALDSSSPDRQYTDVGITVPTGKFPLSREGTGSESAGSTIKRSDLDLFSPPFTGANNASKTWVRFYGSSNLRTRSFCGRCGTPLMYNIRPMPEPWPDMLDIVLGTIDREDLERVDERGVSFLQPERQLWWERGLPWLREAVWEFEGPKHAGSAPNEEVQVAHE